MRYDNEPKIIVSFTSFPARIDAVYKVVECMLGQTIQPYKVVLYLASPQFPDHILPGSLVDIQNNNPMFEVRWCESDIRSYKKLVPALIDFPNDLIITIDDDIIYERDMIESLISTHRLYPKSICGLRVRRISYNKSGLFAPYKKWKIYRKLNILFLGAKPKLKNLATTGGGTLFPPHSLHPDVVKEDVFMKICPTTDDLWFWSMAVLAGTKTAVGKAAVKLNRIEGSVENETLWSFNKKGGNEEAILKIIEQYPFIKCRLGLRD